MTFSRTYTTIDAHTAGEPLRIVTAGVPRIPGDTVLAKRRWAEENLDDVRRALMWEPRGHADMYGALYHRTDHRRGRHGRHLHAQRGLLGYVWARRHRARVGGGGAGFGRGDDARDARRSRHAAGFIEAFVEWDGSRVGRVRFRNVPSFLYRQDLSVETPSFGEVTVDIAFGGAFYAYLEGAQVGLEVTPGNLRALTALGGRG